MTTAIPAAAHSELVPTSKLRACRHGGAGGGNRRCGSGGLRDAGRGRSATADSAAF